MEIEGDGSGMRPLQHLNPDVGRHIKDHLEFFGELDVGGSVYS
jgi:hypothetical protein